ncbi:DDE-type integrase/transposase/recombinase [Paracoccus jeotgali]|uniref:DDE-type integrase/transposase/recombinase n=1 Tax=Paracoccus jeotgali TaxID=2065379 RepID=UPI0035E45BDA
MERPNQVCCVDITFVPMRRGFLFVAAIMDWRIRKVLAEALHEAIYRFGPPEIMNTDQGSQFTSSAWTDRLRQSGVRHLDGWEGPVPR